MRVPWSPQNWVARFFAIPSTIPRSVVNNYFVSFPFHISISQSIIQLPLPFYPESLDQWRVASHPISQALPLSSHPFLKVRSQVPAQLSPRPSAPPPFITHNFPVNPVPSLGRNLNQGMMCY
jgi:hypothetical protein